MITNEKTIDTAQFTEEQKWQFTNAFMLTWLTAGGDADTGYDLALDFAAPWNKRNTKIRVSGGTIQEWAAWHEAAWHDYIVDNLDWEAALIYEQEQLSDTVD